MCGGKCNVFSNATMKLILYVNSNEKNSLIMEKIEVIQYDPHFLGGEGTKPASLNFL